ncbi:MAG: Gfo/Idh/MocA family oxidoreductase [Planctomycetota bacterium]|nr:Gfo/Idh/MocA family oxidoreductase [Planctomycetota bacterium]
MQHKSRITRRSLLKAMGAAGVGAWAAPHILPSGALGANAPSKKLNIAMLACGGRSGQILGSFIGENIVAVCDANANQIARIKTMATEKMGENGAAMAKAKVYEDYRKLLEAEKSVDAVVIAAGQRWHVQMSKAAMLAGKHVFCEKPMAHTVAEAREIRDMGRTTKLATQIGTQGGSSETFRRSMEVIQAGMLGQIAQVHCWINRTFPPSAPTDMNADPIPEGLNWDFWCGPSALLPFKKYYLGGCLAWGRWLEYGDGHLADMGAHALNLPSRALKLGPPQKASVTIPTGEPLKDSYPSATTFRWDYAAREKFGPVAVYWHDGPKAGPPEELAKELLSTYKKTPGSGVLFAGEKGMLLSDAWGVGGVVKLKGDAKFRGVNDHEALKSVPVTLPRTRGHMQEWLEACKGGPSTFQGFALAGEIAEPAMVGIVALRLGKPINWDSAALKAKGAPEADLLIHRELRKKWL